MHPQPQGDNHAKSRHHQGDTEPQFPHQHTREKRKGCGHGICTERDLAFKVLVAGLDPLTTPVEAIMTPNPTAIGPDKPFGHALHLMHEGGFRHMPVIAPDGRPIGVVSAADALGLEIFNFGSELSRREQITEIL